MAAPRQSLDRATETLFSTCDFAEAWARPHRGEYRAAALTVEGSGPERLVYAVQRVGAFGQKYNFLAPDGLPSSPAWGASLEESTVSGLLAQLKGAGAAGFEWNVRFDHGPLAAALIRSGVSVRRAATSVLQLDDDYGRIYAGYSASVRNHIRKAGRRGVTVRQTQSLDDLRSYYSMHLRRAAEKGGYASIYPFELLSGLTAIREAASLLIAEHEGRVIAGGVFLRDGCSVFYFHGAFDSAYAHLFPSPAVLDEAVRRACAAGAAFLNLGGSNGIDSLDRFKSSWGARRELNWRFRWVSPLWGSLARLKSTIRGVLNG